MERTSLLQEGRLPVSVVRDRSSRAGTPTPVLADSVGRWTLDRLGNGDAVFRSAGPSTQHVYFRLPRGARQGGKTWYLIHLHFRVQFSNWSKPGYADVTVLNNAFASAHIRFCVNPGSTDRKLECSNAFSYWRMSAIPPFRVREPATVPAIKDSRLPPVESAIC